MKNNYYDVAYNELLYLEEDYHKTQYNPMVVLMEQVTEKMLKSVLELITTGVEDLLKSHNLKRIYEKIHSIDEDFELNVFELGYLKDFYFEARYPGENFVTVSRKQAKVCLSIMYRVIEEVNKFRERNGMQFYSVEEKFLTPLDGELESFPTE